MEHQAADEVLVVTRGELEQFLMQLKNRCVEEMLVMLPSIITNLIKTTAETERLVREFYDTHRDLLPHKADVARMIEKHEAANPGKPLSAIMELAAADVRQMHAQGTALHYQSLPSLHELDVSLGNL